MSDPLVNDPAAAVAMGRCVAARVREKETPTHPRECGWCSYPTEALVSMIDGFEEWALRDPRSGVPRRFEVVAFQSLPERLQEAAVLDAQAFPDPVASAPPAPSEPAQADVDEEAAWMR